MIQNFKWLTSFKPENPRTQALQFIHFIRQVCIGVYDSIKSELFARYAARLVPFQIPALIKSERSQIVRQSKLQYLVIKKTFSNFKNSYYLTIK